MLLDYNIITFATEIYVIIAIFMSGSLIAKELSDALQSLEGRAWAILLMLVIFDRQAQPYKL